MLYIDDRLQKSLTNTQSQLEYATFKTDMNERLQIYTAVSHRVHCTWNISYPTSIDYTKTIDQNICLCVNFSTYSFHIISLLYQNVWTQYGTKPIDKYRLCLLFTTINVTP